MKDSDASRALKEARSFVKAREYSSALEKYIWFHNHALEYDPAMSGVRLSYAIAEWVELGEDYRPARVALEAIRDEKSRQLASGSQEIRLFLDVRAINVALGQENRTHELFAHIAEQNREFAQKCFPAAIESLVNAKEFLMARSFMPSPDEQLDRFAAPLKSRIGRPDRKDDRFGLSFHETLARIYANKVKEILQILVAVGDEDEAKRVHRAAIDCFDDEKIRICVAELLAPGSPSKLVN